MIGDRSQGSGRCCIRQLDIDLGEVGGFAALSNQMDRGLREFQHAHRPALVIHLKPR